jgi:hypothetical protein
MPKNNIYITKSYFDEGIGKLEEKLDWLIGKYKGHDDEHTLVNGKLSEHSDRLEVVEEKLGIVN